MSMISALQRNKEIYKHIRINYHCNTYVPSRNLAISKTCVAILTISIFNHSGNQFFYSVGGSTDSRIDSSASHVQMLENHLSILHLNIKSIVPKLDMVKAEADLYDIHIIFFSENWLKPEILKTFKHRSEMIDAIVQAVWVIVYVRDFLFCKRRIDLELRGLEAVWLELTLKSKKILGGGYYRPPNSNLAYFNFLEESIGRT